MKKENNIRVEMVRMEGDVAPFVQVDYVDKNAEEHTGLMLLDSACMGNILSNEMAEGIGEQCRMEGEGTTLYSIAHETVNAENVRFSFAFGGTQFHDTFCITPRELPIKVKGMAVIGILGLRFLTNHRMVIDYSDYTLHTSEVNHENLTSTDCSFFFPMEIGLKYYGLPVVCIRQDGKEIVALVDTGATTNLIARKSIEENSFECKILPGKDVMQGITGGVDVGMARVRFQLVSLNGDEEVEVGCSARFAVTPDYIYEAKEEYCEVSEEQVPPAEMLLSSPFIANSRWALDFGAGIAYKRKADRLSYINNNLA